MQSSLDGVLAKISDAYQAFANGIRPRPDLRIWEWADKHRRLPREAAGEYGPWRTSRVPYTREIMDELSPASHTEDVVWMKGSQVAATEVGINFLLYIPSHSPGPTQCVRPSLEEGRRWSRTRLQTSIRDCAELEGKISDKAGNTTFQKDFPGGSLVIVGANSAASLRSMSSQYSFFDEIDGYPDDADGEGDPLKLALRRGTNFSRKKRFFASTPTFADTSRIEKLFKRSDQRYFYVPCPHCQKPQVIRWQNIIWENNNPETAYLRCDHCKEKIEEHHKTWMLENGRWIKHNPKSKIAGFHLSALYSPLGWYSWREAVQDFVDAQGNPLELRVWVNTVLGEVWRDYVTSIDSHYLQKRCEEYRAMVPAGALVLTAGVDTQDNRIECFVYGWGLGEESWLIDHSVFYGNTTDPSVWELLDQHLLTGFEHETNTTMNIAATCIDAMGHATDRVYRFCKEREWRRVFAIQGRAGSGRPIVSSASKKNAHGVLLVQLGVDQGKETIYNRLKQEEPGPGYMHFPQMPEEFFKQLTSEKCERRQIGGLPSLRWVLPSGQRNEALDGTVYALAALRLLKPNLQLLAKDKRVFTSRFDHKPVPRQRRILSRGITV